MPLLPMLRRLRYLLRRDRMTRELEEEMRLHLELRAASISEHTGANATEARHAARRRFGNVGAIRERSRDAWGMASVEQLALDLRHAARRLRLRPGFSVPILVVLALGIGATTAVFSAIDAAMLRPLPFARPDELVVLPDVEIPFQQEIGEHPAWQPPTITQLADAPELFASVAAYAAGGLNLSDPERPVRVKAGVVTTAFFATLGVRPLAGRSFTPDEGKPGGPSAVILSYGLWQRQFGGRELLGTAIQLNDKPYTVVGVMPPRFGFPDESDVWIPMSVPTTFATFEPFRGFLPSRVVARLAPGVTPRVASARMLARWERSVAAAGPRPPAYLSQLLAGKRESGAAILLQHYLGGSRDTALLVLLGATFLLLLIVCANVANLLLSDAATRRREIALREVLGATRRRVVRQLLAESVLLSLGGAALGLALAPLALALLRNILPADLAGVAPVELDHRVLGFAIALSLITALAFGLWPALGSTRGDAGAIIKSGGGHGATAGALGRTRRLLVVAELALTVMLLVGAGLMLRSFEHMMSQDFGMDPEHVGTLEISFTSGAGRRAEQLRVLHAVLARLESSPGITSAGAVNDLPLRDGGRIALRIQPDGASSSRRSAEESLARYLIASGHYFRAMGIPLLRGRSFTSADDTLPPLAVIVSQTTARTFWPGVDALGHTITLPAAMPAAQPTHYTVVGIVADVREEKLEGDPTAQMYFSIDEQAPSNVAIVARGTLPPPALLARLTDAVHAVSPAQAVFNVRTMDAVVDRSAAPRRTNTLLITIFASLALVLSALGVYAVVAYSVAQRTRELGIRAALGATARDLVSLVSGEMAWVLALGVVGGLGGAWALTRLIASQLYGVQPHDAATFALVPLLLVVLAAAATLVPALRAGRVSPAEVMKAE